MLDIVGKSSLPTLFTSLTIDDRPGKPDRTTEGIASVEKRPGRAVGKQAMGKGRWEHFPHEADIGVRGIGASREEAFEQAALALTAVITDPRSVAAGEMVEVECEAPDEELLFVEWLNALVYETATRGMLWGRFEVILEGSRLHGRAWGENVDIDRHRPAVEVKGATYTQLRVGKRGGDWIAQCVVDV